MSYSKYTSDEVLNARHMVALYIVGTFQPSHRVEERVAKNGAVTYRLVSLSPHKGRNAPKRITSKQRRAAKRKAKA